MIFRPFFSFLQDEFLRGRERAGFGCRTVTRFQLVEVDPALETLRIPDHGVLARTPPTVCQCGHLATERVEDFQSHKAVR